jgi:hypothetical protein
MRWRILCEVERVTWGLIANVVFQLFKGNTYLSEVVLYPSTSNIYTDELRGYPSKMGCYPSKRDSHPSKSVLYSRMLSLYLHMGWDKSTAP